MWRVWVMLVALLPLTVGCGQRGALYLKEDLSAGAVPTPKSAPPIPYPDPGERTRPDRAR